MRERSDGRLEPSEMQTNRYAQTDTLIPPEPQNEQSLGELFMMLSDDLSTLVRKEIELAQVEVSEKIEKTTSGLIRMALGGIFALLGAGAVLAAAILALGSLFVYWVAALMIGVLVVLIGLILIQSGRASLSSISLIPKKSLASLQKDTNVIKERVQL